MINQFIFSLSLSSAFKAVNTLNQWYSVEHILFHLQSLFLFVCDLRYKIWYLYTPAKRCIAGVVNLISLEEVEVFFFPNLKQRTQHAFSVNYIPSIIEKKNLAVVWLQCVSSSTWAGEAQFDYRSDFFLFRLTSVTLSIDISWNTLPVHPWDYLACRANALHEYEAIKPQRPEPGYIYIL